MVMGKLLWARLEEVLVESFFFCASIWACSERLENFASKQQKELKRKQALTSNVHIKFIKDNESNFIKRA